MAILDGLLLDNLLQNIVRSEVYIALRSDFKADANRFGAGTAEDPYDGSLVGGVYKFDKIMSDPTKVGANTTIYLGPGEFPTQGYKSGGGSGWSALSGMRIVGGGWAGVVSGTTKGITVLRLEGHDSSSVAVGMDTASSVLNGFELAYVSINCNLPSLPSSTSNAQGIRVSGSHIRIHHVQVFNFGGYITFGSINCVAASVANPISTVYDTVMADCVFETPSPNSANAVITCVELKAPTGGANYHRACVVRNCFIDGTGGSGIRAISATGGVGTILEENWVSNCATGLHIYSGVVAGLPLTIDLIVRDNEFYQVTTGILLGITDTPGSTPPIGRLVLTSNLIELAPTGSPTAINLSASGSYAAIGQLIIRQNNIRHVDGAAGPSGTYGISLANVSEAIVEQNLISIGTDPANPDTKTAVLRNSTVAKMKTFNNQSTSGTFLGCWNSSISMHDGDLVTDVEAAVMAL